MHTEPIAHGFCECGCGERTRIAKVSDSRWGHVAGRPVRWVNGHQRRLTTAGWLEEDRGYETPCWIWQRAMHPSGYGAMRLKGVTHNAHRGVWLQIRGPLSADVVLDHLCRVRSCVNPDHMDPVSNAVNLQRGERVVLSERDVLEIRRRVREGETQASLRRTFGISSGHISGIVHRTLWKNLAEAPHDPR